MRQKILILFILACLTAFLLALKKGMFGVPDDDSIGLSIPDVVDYNFHIKPILSDNCYTCHGPDGNKRKAGLRLDLEDTAFLELKESQGKFALVPGEPNKSRAYLHIIANDPEVIMPP